MENYIVLAPLMGVVALLFAYLLTSRIMKNPIGNERMKEISDAIHEGAMAFLRREYRSLAIFVIVLFIFLAWMIGISTAISFLVALCARYLGYIGMSVATRANVRRQMLLKKGRIKH